jgi:hypothetical protein
MLCVYNSYMVIPTACVPEGNQAHVRDVLDVIFPVVFLVNSITYYVKLSTKKHLC